MENIDFELLEICKAKIGKEEEFKNEKIENIPCVDEDKLAKEEKERLEQIGAKVIKEGKYAVVTLAGGQRNKVRV